MDRNLSPDQVDFSLVEEVQLVEVSHQSCAAFVMEIAEEDWMELLALLKCISQSLKNIIPQTFIKWGLTLWFVGNQKKTLGLLAKFIMVDDDGIDDSVVNFVSL